MVKSLDLLATFKSLRKLLKLFGLWREENSSTLLILRSILLHLLFIEVYLLHQFIYIFKLNDVAELSKLLKMCITYVALFLKSMNFVWKFRKIASLEKSLETLFQRSACEWHCRIEKTFPYVNRIRRIFNVLWISSLTVVCLGLVFAVVNRSEKNLQDKMWIPFDYKASEILYLVVAFYQFCGALYACTINTALDIYPVFCLSILTSATDDLKKQLQAVKTHEEIVRSADKHQLIKRCSDEIRFIFSPVILAQAVCSSIILCTTAFSLSTVSTWKLLRVQF